MEEMERMCNKLVPIEEEIQKEFKLATDSKSEQDYGKHMSKVKEMLSVMTTYSNVYVKVNSADLDRIKCLEQIKLNREENIKKEESIEKDHEERNRRDQAEEKSKKREHVLNIARACIDTGAKIVIPFMSFAFWMTRIREGYMYEMKDRLPTSHVFRDILGWMKPKNMW